MNKIKDWDIEIKRIACELWHGKELDNFAKYFNLNNDERLSIIASNAVIK